MKTFKKNLRPMIVIPVVLVVGLIVGGYFLFFGDDDQTASVPRPVLTPGDLNSEEFRGRKIKPPPRKRRGTLDVSRQEGRLVQAQARGTVVKPGRIRLRVSAAPKQTVTVDWQLGCFLNRRAKVGRGKYRAKAPDVRAIRVSIPGAESCIVTATAGLTRVDGRGRVKVAVIAG